MRVKVPESIDDKLQEYHSKLVATIVGNRDIGAARRVVEIGSGSGLFTIPLLEAFGNNIDVLYCVDPYVGPYSSSRTDLESRLRTLGLDQMVEIVTIDASEVDGMISDIDLVIGHEVLCDLTADSVIGVLQAAFNMLVEGGNFIHSEFSPFTANRAQELLHHVNEHSREPISNTKWFSPSADELAGIGHFIGFRSIHVDYARIPIRFEDEAALEMIKRWDPHESFQDEYYNEVLTEGIEFPLEQILYCQM